MRAPTPRPCDECPWRRSSARGWLGPYTARVWLRLARSDQHIACHLSVDAADGEGLTDDELGEDARHCAGADVFRSNVAKRPRHLDHEQLSADREAVFASPREFSDHHEGTR